MNFKFLRKFVACDIQIVSLVHCHILTTFKHDEITTRALQNKVTAQNERGKTKFT